MNPQESKSHPVKHFYEFGKFRLDLEERILSNDGETVALAPKVFKTLLLLIEHKGRIVGKDEMMQTLWPDQFVEDSNLTQNIFMLRKILGGTSGKDQYIETVPRRGYHFIGTVREVQEEIKHTEESGPAEDQESGAQLSKHYTQNPEAYQAYWKGRHYRNQRTGEGYQKAIKSFEEAIKLDPGYAPAHCALADSYVSFDFFGVLPPWESSPKAKAAAINALAIDDTLAEAHTSLACVKMMYERDWVNAEREFKKAIELDPNYAHAHNWYSHFLMAMGRIEESFAENKIALKLDPLDDSVNQYLGWHHIHARQFDRAIAQLEKTLAHNSDFFLARVTLGMAYEQKGEVAKAIEEFNKAYKLEENSIVRAFLGHAYALAGNIDEARNILEELEELSKRKYVPPYSIGLIYTALGETTEAFGWLEKAYVAQNEWLNWLKVAPEVDRLRSDPRFTELQIRLRLLPDNFE